MRSGKYNIRQIILCLGFALLALSSGGCAALLIGGAVAGGAAGYAYYKGSIPRDFPTDFERTWAATNYALSDLGYPVVRVEKSFQNGVIESRTAEGNNIMIHLSPSPAQEYPTDSATRVHIRVAVFGDKALSDRIFHQIESRLQLVLPPPPPVPNLQQPVPVTKVSPIPTVPPQTPQPNIPATHTVPNQTAPPPLAPMQPNNGVNSQPGLPQETEPPPLALPNG